ncbi:hypothetical protein PMAYCL1PPCAC_30897, partial [Pristionchus mayeri]
LSVRDSADRKLISAKSSKTPMNSKASHASSASSTETMVAGSEPNLRNEKPPKFESEFSIFDYIYTWQVYIPMLMLMAAAPLLEAWATVMVLWEWGRSLDGFPTDLPPINWTAWVLRLPHIGVSIIFARRLVVGYIRAKEKRIRDEQEGVQRSRHV